MSITPPTCWSKFCRGFFDGSCLGAVLFGWGIGCWGVSTLLGMENSKSGEALPGLTAASGFAFVFSLYVMFFGLGGSAIGLLAGEKPTRFQATLAWVAAAFIVIGGSFLIVATALASRTIPPAWGVLSCAVVTALLVVAHQGRKQPVNRPEIPSPPSTPQS